MNSDDLAEFLQETFDPDEERFGCYSCTCYETHHYPKNSPVYDIEFELLQTE